MSLPMILVGLIHIFPQLNLLTLHYHVKSMKALLDKLNLDNINDYLPAFVQRRVMLTIWMTHNPCPSLLQPRASMNWSATILKLRLCLSELCLDLESMNGVAKRDNSYFSAPIIDNILFSFYVKKNR